MAKIIQTPLILPRAAVHVAADPGHCASTAPEIGPAEGLHGGQ